MEKRKVISLNINIISYQQALFQVIQYAQNKVSAYVCFANVHMVIEAYKNSDLKKLVNASAFTFSDGMPLVYAIKKLYGIKQDRIAGIDFMLDILSACEKNNLSVFFFGSTKNVLANLNKNILQKFPKLKIAGSISPPFKTLSVQENEQYAKTINESGANIVLVSLGCPKQETWAAQNHKNIAAVLLAVGAAFEIHANLKKRAPLWMQRTGLEWLYRFLQDPFRLGKRYFNTNILYIYLLYKKILFGK